MARLAGSDVDAPWAASADRYRRFMRHAEPVGSVFEDAGEHELKGVPDRWHLYRVAK
jgi:hypothetical protein